MLCGLGERQKQRDIFLCERHTNSGVFAATEIPSQMQDISTSSSSIHKASAQLLLSGPEKFPHYFSIHWDFALTWICFSSGEFSERERERVLVVDFFCVIWAAPAPILLRAPYVDTIDTAEMIKLTPKRQELGRLSVFLLQRYLDLCAHYTWYQSTRHIWQRYIYRTDRSKKNGPPHRIYLHITHYSIVWITNYIFVFFSRLVTAPRLLVFGWCDAFVGICVKSSTNEQTSRE